ncbi:MAG: hypothetical protein WC723_04110 [Candidatus Omnitrophota bacterium]
MKAKVLILALLGSCALGFLGCADLSNKNDNLSKNSNLLEPSAALKFNDVPVPMGFKSLPQGSYSFETSGVRVGVLKYQGKANPDQLINFYKEQMPLYNWNLLNIVEYGDRLMNFDRENETCIISLLSKGSTSIITVSLGPKPQQISQKKPKQPVK